MADIAPLPSPGVLGDVRDRVDELAADANKKTGQVAALEVRGVTARYARPGDEDFSWSSTLIGPAKERPVGIVGLPVNNANMGASLRIRGADVPAGPGYLDVGLRADFAVEEGRTYGVTYVLARAIDPTDPVGHGVELRLQNLSASKAHVSNVRLGDVLTPTVAGGVFTLSFLIGKAGAPGTLAYIIPPTARYVVPYIRIYGNGQETDLAVIGRIEDVTDAISGGADLALKADKTVAISGGGLAAGGGTLETNRTITVTAATNAEALAGTATDKAMTPAGTKAVADTKVDKTISISGAGLATGGGTLSAPRTVTVTKASVTEAIVGQRDDVATTPAVVKAAIEDRFGRDFAVDDSTTAVHQLVSDDGVPLLTFDKDGKLIGVAVITESDFATAESDGSAALVSADYALLQEWGATDPGPEPTPEGTAFDWLKPYVTPGNQLRAIGGGSDHLLFDLEDCTALAVHAVATDCVSAVIDTPSIGPGTLILAKPAGKWLYPAEQAVLHINVAIGQSLAVGHYTSTNPTLSGVTRDGAFMFTTTAYSDLRLGLSVSDVTAIDSAYLTGFQALTAKVSSSSALHVQTFLETMAFTLADEMAAAFPDRLFRSLNIVSGQNGTAYAGMAKGTPCYANVITAVTRAKALAEALGWKVVVDAIFVKHGEADAANASYKANLVQWRQDYDTDLRAITGQAAPVHFIMQVPSSFGNSTFSQSVIAMIELHNESPYFHVSGCDYAYQQHFYSGDYLHMTGPGAHKGGEFWSRAYREVFWSPKRKAQLCQMLTAVRSGLEIETTWQVPVAPLVFDTVAMPERDVKGFTVTDSAGSYTISSAVITDDGTATGTGKIKLTLASAPTGTGLSVGYARSGQSATRTQANIPRGNVRDSAPEVSSYDASRLYNWGLHKVVPVT